MSAWTFTEADRDFVLRHVGPYLPDRVFDAHAHLFSQTHFPAGKVPAHLEGAPVDLGIDRYREYIEWLHPNGRTKGGLFFGLAFQGDRAANDRFVMEEVRKGLAQGFAARGQMLIAPEMDAEYVREAIRRAGNCESAGGGGGTGVDVGDGFGVGDGIDVGSGVAEGSGCASPSLTLAGK